MKKIFSFTAVGSLFLWNACATMSVDKARLKGIKKVAVVGFTVEQEMPKGVSLFNVGDSDNSAFNRGAPSIASGAAHSTEMYELLQNKLRNLLKWNIMDRKVLTQNPKYAALFDKKMKGFQNRIVRGPNIKVFGADNVIETFPFQTMSAEEKMQVAKDLNVDAIVVATLNVKLERGGGLKNLVGAGDYRPRATLQFYVYDKTNPDPVWADWNAVGAELDGGAEHVMGITRQDDLNQKVIQAADYAYERLIEHFKNAKS